MSLLSRCDGSPRYVGHVPVSAKPGAGSASAESSPRAAIATFFEELGILFRYAAGLDYYGRRLLSGKR